jgi:hypothetical protein
MPNTNFSSINKVDNGATKPAAVKPLTAAEQAYNDQQFKAWGDDLMEYLANN